jgi:phosphoribosyl 1,2-cyclic phosphodiesterase
MLRFRSLGSGSSGNATVVEARCGHSVTRLLVDCGFGLRALERRLALAGLGTGDIDAIFVTHEHGDHIGCARALALRERIPVWMSHGTWQGHGAVEFDGLLNTAVHDQAIGIGDLHLHPFAVPHDAREPLQLTCTDGAKRLGVLTDLGHAPGDVLMQLTHCNALLLECNHDPELLAASSYPPFLKRRVGGLHGHLPNAAAAAVVQAVRHDRLNHVVAAHLSAKNNRPALARAALAEVLERAEEDILVADAVLGTDWVSV